MKLEELNQKYLVDKDDFYVSLVKATGKQIKDIYGYFADPFGGGVTFGLSRILFDDGSLVWVDGEHDWAYVSGDFLDDLDAIEPDDDEDG